MEILLDFLERGGRSNARKVFIKWFLKKYKIKVVREL